MDIKSLLQEDIKSFFPKRNFETHKGDYGKILLLCGSRGYTGAPYLASMGALRTGAGLVYLGVPESIYPIMAKKLTEPVVIPLRDRNGMFAKKSVDAIRKILTNMDAVLIGCGLGLSEDTETVVKTVLDEFKGTVILDADGINAMKAHKDSLRGRIGQTVITPHFGEFSRFIGFAPSDRISSAVEVAKDLNVIVLLKGHETVITDGTTCYINKTGNPGMAVGGSGDLLAGIITSLTGQGIAPLEAAAVGAWLHGKAGDICAEEIGEYGMLPSDMLNVLPRLLK